MFWASQGLFREYRRAEWLAVVVEAQDADAGDERFERVQGECKERRKDRFRPFTEPHFDR